MLARSDGIKRRGFTLTELAIVMGVVGTILGAIWWAAGNAKELQRQNTAVQEMQTVVKNIDDLMAGQTLPGPFSYPANKLTSAMITAQVIPTTYVNVVTPTTADNPWSPGAFVIYQIAAKTIRVSYYNVSQPGCVALLLQMTACQFGQSGCPTQAILVGAAKTCTPTTCDGTTYPGTAGWQILGSTKATTLCGYNSYTGGANSVEFDFAL